MFCFVMAEQSYLITMVAKKPEFWESLKNNLEFWTKIIKNPETLNNFYMLSSKIFIWHNKYTI